MTDEELMKRLKSAVDHAAPDDLAGVLARCGGRQSSVSDINKRPVRTGKSRRRGRLVAACLAALLLVGGGGGLFYQRAYAVASVVSLDVNPSIELKVNQKEKVLSCTGLNEEAAAVLADMDGGRDLKGAKLDVAVNAIVGALVRNGYLDRLDSAILISVEDSDAARGARLQQELVASVDGVLQTASNTAAVLSQSLTADRSLNARAQQNNISTGKAHLADQAAAMNGDLDFNALAALSVEELRDLIELGAPAMPIGADAALQAALDYAGLDGRAALQAEVDPELDEAVPCYEVELDIDGRELEYGVDAFTGQVLRGVKLPAAGHGPATSHAAAQPQEEQKVAAQTDGGVSREQAVDAALGHAGLTADQVYDLEAERDLDDGRKEYEVSFKADGWEYEYTLDAATGAILDHEREIDD